MQLPYNLAILTLPLLFAPFAHARDRDIPGTTLLQFDLKTTGDATINQCVDALKTQGGPGGLGFEGLYNTGKGPDVVISERTSICINKHSGVQTCDADQGEWQFSECHGWIKARYVQGKVPKIFGWDWDLKNPNGKKVGRCRFDPFDEKKGNAGRVLDGKHCRCGGVDVEATCDP